MSFTARTGNIEAERVEVWPDSETADGSFYINKLINLQPYNTFNIVLSGQHAGGFQFYITQKSEITAATDMSGSGSYVLTKSITGLSSSSEQVATIDISAITVSAKLLFKAIVDGGYGNIVNIYRMYFT